MTRYTQKGQTLMAKPKQNRSRSKIKIEKQVQDLKASIADKSGTDEERSIEHAENMADILDEVQSARRLIDDLHVRVIHMARLLDRHLPDWRERIPPLTPTGSPDRPSSRWSAAPLVSKPATVPVIIGALKYALSANKHDILSPLAEPGGDASLIAIDQRIVDGEERIARITRVIARLQAGGFDTTAAEALHATMTASLNLMREQRRLLASEKWRTQTSSSGKP